jgi:glycosyltransferase involved in cell wall biosynthesis
MALAQAGLRHHLEIHDIEALTASGTLGKIIGYHRAGLIGCLVPISAGAAARLVEAGADPARIHVAHSGVKLEAYTGLAPFEPNKLQRPRIVHLGRLSGPRGLEVFRRFALRGDCEITVVSTDKRPIENVTYQAPVPLAQVPGWYARSDLTLLPYQADIATVATMSPIKMFEAMAAGRPIIASDLPTIREVLEHERTALLVKPDDLDAWEQACERLRADHDLASTLARNAQAEAVNYSWVARARGIAVAIGLTA